MASVMSKRQQARNEKSLQDLVHNVAGNNFCADCQARNPSWASWSLGVFLCMRCASIHRKLGTHISKVKSLSMDGWSNEQVENMKKVGNVTSNRLYNPQNNKPPVPVDVDEADSAMERFIRSKYVTNPRTTKSSTSRISDEGTPPPLPPKSSSKFSFRSASSILPLSSRSKKASATRANTMPSPQQDYPLPRSPSPDSHLHNKPSKVFGATVQPDSPEDIESKLASLRDMGFTDVQKNLTILKGVNGNLERAVETLVRLGNGGRKSPAVSSTVGHTLRTSRSMTPVTPHSAPTPQQPTLQDHPHTPSTVSSNPFDMLPPAQPQTAQSTGTLQNKNPYYNTNTNPFGVPMGRQDINQAFDNLSLAPPQPLFPNHTGGAQLTGAPSQPAYQQQSPAPSVPSVPQNYAAMAFNGNMTYPQPAQVQPQQTGAHPSFTNQAQQQPPQQQQQNLTVNPMPNSPAGLANNPFARSPTRIQSPSLGQIPEQTQSSSFYGSPQPLSPSVGNPFFTQQQQQQQQHQQQQQEQQYQQQQRQPYQQEPRSAPLLQQQPQDQFQNPYQPQFTSQNPYHVGPQQQQQQGYQQAYQQYQPQGADKASILALYNQPQLAPQPVLDPNQQAQQQQQQQGVPNVQGQAQQQQPEPQQGQLPRSATMPVTSTGGNSNPFFNHGGAVTAGGVAPAGGGVGRTLSVMAPAVPDQQKQQTNHGISRDSMAFSDMNWANGRHSPDAFASLSSRHI